MKQKYKKIVVGDIHETFMGTPIKIFKQAIKLSKHGSFLVCTNNPQFVEALEVFCNKKDIDIYLKLNNTFIHIDFPLVYEYLGDLYDTIDMVRIAKCFEDTHIEEYVKEEIYDYEKKYFEIINKNV